MPVILHVVSSLKLGGAERFTLELAQLQRNKGYDASLLSLGGNDDFLISAAHNLSIPLVVSNSSQGRIRRYRDVAKLLYRSDVVHFHNTFGLRFMIPLLLLFPRKKYIYTRHGIYRFNTFRWKLFHQFIRLFINYVTFVTETGMEVFKLDHRWNPERLKVIENGVYIPQQQQRTLHTPMRFGSVGRMVALKGQKYLLDSVAKIQSHSGGQNTFEGFEIHFFGSGPLEKALKLHANRINDKTKIEFHGVELDREKIYQEIDALIVSSSSEGMSLVIMEAMARGIPIIATDVGGNTTLVTDCVSGIIIDYGDEEAMAGAILQFVHNPELVIEYGSAAQSIISEKYSLTRTLDFYADLYGV